MHYFYSHNQILTDLFFSFIKVWRQKGLPLENKAIWLREVYWLLCVCDHIVELMLSHHFLMEVILRYGSHL